MGICEVCSGKGPLVYIGGHRVCRSCALADRQLVLQILRDKHTQRLRLIAECESQRD